MKFHQTIALALIAGLPEFNAAQAQVPPLPGPPPGPPPAPQALQDAQSSGRVTRLLINPNGDIDGLLLDQGMQVATPPHLSGAIGQDIHVGDTVSVQGPAGRSAVVIHARVISDHSNGRTITEQPPAAPPPPPTSVLAPLSVQGRVERLLFTDAGDLNGALLADGSIVRWPPHLSAQLRDSVNVRSMLVASGYGTENALGRSLEASSLSIDGKPALDIFSPGPR